MGSESNPIVYSKTANMRVVFSNKTVNVLMLIPWYKIGQIVLEQFANPLTVSIVITQNVKRD